MLSKLWELKSVGVSFIIISHVKRTDITDVMTEEQYTMLTANTTQKYFNAIKTKLDFLGMAYIDRDLVKYKSKKKDKDGKEIEKNRISAESRVINFRDDTYSVDSKCRFANIVDRIPFDSDAFIKAMQDAILAEQSYDGISVAEATKKQKAEAKEAAKVASENSAKAREKKIEAELEENRDDYIATIQEKFQDADADTKKKAKELLASAGVKKFTDPDLGITILKEIAELF